MKTSPVLVAELRRAVDRLRAGVAFDRARSRAIRVEHVAAYLENVEYLVRHTPLHLERGLAAAGRARAQGVARHFALKLEEERGHDAWAAADIRDLARRFGVAPPHEPLPAMRALVDYLGAIAAHDPWAYFGYALFAEYVTVELGEEWIAAVSQCGVTAASMSVVARHVELDRAHRDEGFRTAEWLLADGADLERALSCIRGALERFEAFTHELVVAG